VLRLFLQFAPDYRRLQLETPGLLAGVQCSLHSDNNYITLDYTRPPSEQHCLVQMSASFAFGLVHFTIVVSILNSAFLVDQELNLVSLVATHLCLLLVVVVVTVTKSLKFRRFKSDRCEIWQDCSSSR